MISVVTKDESGVYFIDICSLCEVGLDVLCSSSNAVYGLFFVCGTLWAEIGGRLLLFYALFFS